MDSLSSSRQVSAPASRYGESSTAGPDTPTSYTVTTPTGLPAIGQTEAPIGITSQLDRNISASPTASEARSSANVHESIPGAFPGDTSSNDPFSLTKDPPRTPTTAKDDFDAAFAGFGGPSGFKERQTSSSSNEGTAKTTGAFNKEFPPLKELEQEDDDSDDSDERGGFEDDFTPASPSHSRNPSSKQGQSSPPPVGVANDGANSPSLSRPTVSQSASAMSMGGDPPTAAAQSSPPAYDKTVSPHDKAHAEVSQYSGLPTREDPTSSPHPHTKEQAFNNQAMTGSQAPFGSIQNTTSSLPPPSAKVPFDDFDHDFEDLVDAEEGGVDDDFANISSLDRSGALDFDTTFDSPAASKTSQHTAKGSSSFGVESNGFGDFIQSPAKVTAAQPPSMTTGLSTADSHDWDAFFAGLDQPSTTSDAFEVKNTAPVKTNGTSIAADSSRPTLGRALTEAGEHDDPILKDLTAMGYARKDALTALEKYDYNLERVSSIPSSRC
jgi:epidermal growth factor receptor substrate 15